MYCSFMNITQQQLHDESYPAAEAALRTQAAVDEIVKLENMTVTEAEIGEAIALICRQNGMTVEQFKPYFNAEFEAAVRKNVLTTKVMQLIREAANIIEK